MLVSRSKRRLLRVGSKAGNVEEEDRIRLVRREQLLRTCLSSGLMKSWIRRPTCLTDDRAARRCGSSRRCLSWPVVWWVRLVLGVPCWQPRLLGKRYRFQYRILEAAKRVASAVCWLAQRLGVHCTAGLPRRSICVPSRLMVLFGRHEFTICFDSTGVLVL